MKRRNTVRIISLFGAMLLILTGTLLCRAAEKREYRRMTENIHSNAVNTLCNSLASISAELKKAVYASTAPMLSMTAAEIYKESAAAMNSLSHLPSENGEQNDLYKFISQAGDYALYLSRQSLSGTGITEEERENLRLLSKNATKIADDTEQMRIEHLQSGTFRYPSLSQDTGVTKPQEQGDYPPLIYDGPYSDHIMTETSYLLESSEEITEPEARRIAASALETGEDTLRLTTQTEGKIASYHFESENASVSVTKRGGYISYFRKQTKQEKPLFSYEQAVSRAKTWLSSFTNMAFETSYYIVDEGVCTVNFAYKEGATVCYSDLVKIGVALDSGEIVLCEANGYIMNHKPRTIKTPEKTLKEASAVISDELTVQKSARVLIPTGGKHEIQCYEFTCENAEGEDVLVYINCDTLAEERIYLVIDIKGGSLTK